MNAGTEIYQDDILHLVRPEVRALAAYAVADATGLIKLDAMENPYGWPEELRTAWLAEIQDAALNRYPDPTASALTARLRERINLIASHGILLGNGSDELIQLLMLATDGAVVAPEPTFAMYRLIAAYTGRRYIGVPLAADFALDATALCQTIARERPALVFLAYPNNPTGNLFDAEALRAVLETSSGVVVVDEAYLPFAEVSVQDWLTRYPHLVILRTLSKLGLAGLRLGYLIARGELINAFDKVRLPYNINILTQKTAAFALQHHGFLLEQAAAIRVERARLVTALSARNDFKVYPSRANFILFRASPGRGPVLFAALKQAGVLIKNLHGAHPALSDCLRVTVGTPEENAAFLRYL